MGRNAIGGNPPTAHSDWLHHGPLLSTQKDTTDQEGASDRNGGAMEICWRSTMIGGNHLKKDFDWMDQTPPGGRWVPERW